MARSPRCALIVHHGGAGTTATTFRAGRPGLAVSLFADGPFRGHRLRALGVGDHIACARQSEAALSAAITRLAAAQVAKRAKALADGMQREDGVGCAADRIDQWVRQGARQAA